MIAKLPSKTLYSSREYTAGTYLGVSWSFGNPF